MSGWRRDELRSTIPFEDIELLEVDGSDDLLIELPDDGAPVILEPTVARLPQRGTVHQAQTRRADAWDVTPPLGELQPSNRQQKVYDEITAVRSAPERDAPWVDMHAVVDERGRLRLPEKVARQLREGAIVEVRLASWAVPDGV